MRIAHIGHGRIEIPPKASGAVEAIISDYQFWCEKLGHEFLIVNEQDPEKALLDAVFWNPDIVHLHDESKIDWLARWATIPLKIVTTHDPTFFEKPNPFIKRFVEGNFMVGCLCQRYADLFVKAGVAPDRILLTPNGARADLIWWKDEPEYPDRAVCLGMIGTRKRQHLIADYVDIDCAGPISAYDYFDHSADYMPEWTKEQVYHWLTEYAALVLISKSEAAPLVVVEALMAGLDVVVSEVSAANLDRSHPFIHVLDERTITNPLLMEMALKKVLARTKDRQAVRTYAEQNFDWAVLAKNYLTACYRLLRNQVTASPTNTTLH